METSALTFLQPAWFFALLIVPVVAALYFWSQKRSDALIAKVVAPRLRAQLAGAVSVGRRAFKSVLILATFALVAVALARPQMGFTQREVKQRGRDVIIAVDTSRSMLATDVSPTRLARAKLVAQDLLRLVRGDRVGLVAFAGSAQVVQPPTLSREDLVAAIDKFQMQRATAIGSAIVVSLRCRKSLRVEDFRDPLVHLHNDNFKRVIANLARGIPKITLAMHPVKVVTVAKDDEGHATRKHALLVR